MFLVKLYEETLLLWNSEFTKTRAGRNQAFGEKAVFLNLASNTGISSLLNFSARWIFAKFWLIIEENILANNREVECAKNDLAKDDNYKFF